MLGIERRRQILDMLRRARKVYVADLSESLSVTRETIRRDLEKLEAGGLLQRSHGGAVLVTRGNEELSFAKRTIANYGLKQKIAERAVGLFDDGASLMMDSSSTVFALCALLAAKQELTVITNSIKILGDHSASGMSLISTGGNLWAHSLSLVGEAACRTIATYNVDFAVVSCKGIDRDRGVTESNEPESVVKRAMTKQAKNRILLADSTKFDKIAFAKTLDFSDIDYVITDTDPGPQWMELFDNSDIQVVF